MARPLQISLRNFVFILSPTCIPPQSWTPLSSGPAPRALPSSPAPSSASSMVSSSSYASMMSGAPERCSQPWTLMRPLQIPVSPLDLLHSRRFALPSRRRIRLVLAGGNDASYVWQSRCSRVRVILAGARGRRACSIAGCWQRGRNRGIARSIRGTVTEQLVGGCSWSRWHFRFILTVVLVGRGHDFFAQAFSAKLQSFHPTASVGKLLERRFVLGTR